MSAHRPHKQSDPPLFSSQDPNLRARLSWVTFVRLVLYVSVLSTLFLFYLKGDFARYPWSMRIATQLIIGALISVVGYAIWLRINRTLRVMGFLQVVVDQFLWTALAYLTGGPSSIAASLYGLSTVLSASALGLQGAVVGSLVGAGLFAALVWLITSGLLVLPSDQGLSLMPWAEMLFSLVVSCVGLLAVAVLAGYLAQRLQSASSQVRVANARADRAERFAILGSLATALAHEIRNPLGSIKGSIELVRESPGLGDDERRLCDIIRRESERLSDLVTDMMDLARPKKPTFEVFDIGRSAADVVTLSGRSLASETVVSYQGPDSLSCTGDAGQIRQLLWNLVRNSLQASPDNTPVVVHIERFEHAIEIAVIDRGTGIADDLKPRVFDPFFTSRSNGAGIGLAVVRQIVESHQGLIEVLDTEGGGTTMRVVLPIGQGSEAAMLADVRV
jgi:signal transduction histidine kinase